MKLYKIYAKNMIENKSLFCMHFGQSRGYFVMQDVLRGVARRAVVQHFVRHTRMCRMLVGVVEFIKISLPTRPEMVTTDDGTNVVVDPDIDIEADASIMSTVQENLVECLNRLAIPVKFKPREQAVKKVAATKPKARATATAKAPLTTYYQHHQGGSRPPPGPPGRGTC